MEAIIEAAQLALTAPQDPREDRQNFKNTDSTTQSSGNKQGPMLAKQTMAGGGKGLK